MKKILLGIAAIAGVLTVTPAFAQTYYGRQSLEVKGGAAGGSAATISIPQWVNCAYEGGYCAQSGQVRYGTGGSWVTKTVTGGISCNTAGFGSDPAWGWGKECQYQSGAITIPAPPTTNAEVPVWPSNDAEIDKNIAFLKWAAAQAPGLAAGGPVDEVEVGAGVLYAGVIESTLYKPWGGKFGNRPYITFYINQEPWGTFCAKWNQQKPANMSDCDNWYGRHIVLYL